MSAEAVISDVARDADFFRNSGGGVTFSGGEPFAQVDYLRGMLELLRQRTISTAVETSGYANPADLASLEPLIDLFLFDLKVMDPARHAQLTGRDNALVLSNLRWLAAHARAKVVIRHAVVPGLNDDPANHAALARLMLELGLARLELEPYHPFGEPKYAGLGLSCTCTPDPRALDGARMAELTDYFTGRGLACEVV
jgi:pyruvate formate lyase activating enzyme